MTGGPADEAGNEPLLEIENLSKHYPILRRGLFRQRQSHEIRAVDGVSFALREGETLGLVGESGCGKTTTARAILNLVPPSEGAIRFAGQDLIKMFRENDRTRVLGVRRSLQYVFQDPWLSLNPRWSIGDTLREPLRVHMQDHPERWSARIAELLGLVGLEAQHAWRYPHELSGGQRQRVGIARALAIEPRLLILDEPVSALDVSVRAQILNLLVEVQERLGLAYLYISHDLSSVRFISTHVAVMYLGRLVEIGPVDAIFTRPLHHYTAALIQAIPVPEPGLGKRRKVLQGEVPSAMVRPPGCPFHPRCAAALPVCREVVPEQQDFGDGHRASCHNPV